MSWVNSGNWVGMPQSLTGVALAQLAYTLNEFEKWAGRGEASDSFQNACKEWENQTGQTSDGLPLTKFISNEPGGTEQAFPPTDFFSGLGKASWRATLEENLHRIRAGLSVLFDGTIAVSGAPTGGAPYGAHPFYALSDDDVYKPWQASGRTWGPGFHPSTLGLPFPASGGDDFTDNGDGTHLGGGGEFPASPKGALNALLTLQDRFNRTNYVYYAWTGNGWAYDATGAFDWVEWAYKRYQHSNEAVPPSGYDVADFEADWETAKAASYGAWAQTSTTPSNEVLQRDVALWCYTRLTTPLGPGPEWEFTGGKLKMRYIRDTAIAPGTLRWGTYVAGGGLAPLSSPSTDVVGHINLSPPPDSDDVGDWSFKSGAAATVDLWGQGTLDLVAAVAAGGLYHHVNIGENWPAANDELTVDQEYADMSDAITSMDDSDFARTVSSESTYHGLRRAGSAGGGIAVRRPIDGPLDFSYGDERLSYIHNIGSLKTYADAV